MASCQSAPHRHHLKSNLLLKNSPKSPQEVTPPPTLEVGDGREFVPLHRLLAEVKVLQPQRDSAQEEVLPKRLGAEHTQLELPQAQTLFAVAAVDQLWRRRSVSLGSGGRGRGLRQVLTISLNVGFLVLLEVFVLRLDVLCGSGSRYVFT